MKKKDISMRYRLILSFIFILLVYQVSAQAPALLNYQGVARNAAGVPLPDQNLSLRVSIRNNSASGLVVFSETRTIQTNTWGLFSVQIGSAGATISSGSLANVDWLTGTKFMELEMDPAGGSNFINLGSTQLLSVPYAFNALTAGSAPPSGTAGGDLTGSYPNPVIANNAILTSKLADLSVTDSKIVGVSGSKVIGDINGKASNVTGIISIANGGTGATTIQQARINLGLNTTDTISDLNKPVSKPTQDSLLLKMNIADSALMLQSYARKNQVTDSIAAVRNAANQKLNASDTASMLSPYILASNVSNIVSGKMNVTDSASMLQPYARNTVVTDSISAVRNAVKQKLNASDTASMLSPYILASNASNIVSGKMNVTDSASMLQPYVRKTLLTDSINSVRSGLGQKLNISDTAAMLLPYRKTNVKITDSDLASSYLGLTGGILTGTLSGTSGKFSDTLTTSVIIKTGGTASQFLMADGSVSSGPAPVREVADEFSATASQTAFTLTQTPSVNSKVKMYINGVRISNNAYSVSGAVLTYTAAINGSYALTASDRIQFDYYY